MNLEYVWWIPEIFHEQEYSYVAFLVCHVDCTLEGPEIPSRIICLHMQWYRALPFKLVILLNIWFLLFVFFEHFFFFVIMSPIFNLRKHKGRPWMSYLLGISQCDFFSLKILMTVLIFCIANYKQNLQNQDLLCALRHNWQEKRPLLCSELQVRW